MGLAAEPSVDSGFLFVSLIGLEPAPVEARRSGAISVFR